MSTIQQTTKEPIIEPAIKQRFWGSLFVALCLFELCCLLIVALSPLPELHLSGSPLATSWRWTLLPSHLLLTILGSSAAQWWIAPSLLGLALLGLSGTYAYTIRRVLRFSKDENADRRWLFLLLGGAIVYSLTLLFQPMLFSDDIFSYIFSGRILAVYHADPLNTAPIQFSTDPYLQWVISGRNAPNLYGPLWYCLASLFVSVGGSQVTTLLLFKGAAILSHLANTVLVWCILERVAPRRRVLGTLLYAWNPLVLIEVAGSGHNEGVLLTLLLLATWFYVLRNGSWSRLGTLLLFGLALSTNLIVSLLAPLLIWFDVRTERHIPRALWGFCWRALLVLVPALVIWLPFWRGASTFFAITSAIDMQHFVHSPIGTLVGPTHGFFRLVAYVLRFPPFLQPIPAADVTLRGSATFIFALIYSNMFGQVRHAPTTLAGMRYSPSADEAMEMPGVDVLLRAWNIAAFAYLVLVSGWFWPWYLLWMLWIVVLRRFDTFTSTMLVLSGTALFFYLFMGLTGVSIALYQPALIFGLPLVYLAIVKGRHRRTERTDLVYEQRS